MVQTEKSRVMLGNGIELAYLERPVGDKPVVLLHGITDNARTYETLMARLPDQYHVYALDFRGHGESTRPDEQYATDTYADDVRRFIREKIGGPVMLAGHSLGGLVTVQVAATAPELVTRILLEDPPLYFVGQLNDIYKALFEGLVFIASTLQDGSKSREEWFEVMANAPDPYSGKPGIETMGAEKIHQRLDSLSQMYPKALRDGLDGSLVWDADEVLAKITCPVTLLTGNAKIGSVMTASESEKVKSLLTDCEHIHYPDVGHLVHDQKPDAWLAAIERWSGRQ